jgi:hypothetical protein
MLFPTVNVSSYIIIIIIIIIYVRRLRMSLTPKRNVQADSNIVNTWKNVTMFVVCCLTLWDGTQSRSVEC